MSDEKTISVARAVQGQIYVTEEAIDTALSEAASLMESYVTSRRTLRMAAMTTTGVQENTLKAMQALNEAQAYMAAAHKGLSRIQKRIGIEPHLMPTPFDIPKDDKDGISSSAAPSPETILP